MATKPRAWSDLDRIMMDFIKEARENEPKKKSLRAIEADTGISHSRVDDLFNERSGSPTLKEFVSLSLLFGLDPAYTMRLILDRLEKLGVHLATDTVSSGSVPTSPVADGACDAGERAEELLTHADNGVDIDVWADQIKAEESAKTK